MQNVVLVCLTAQCAVLQCRMKQFVVEVKCGPGRWDPWTERGVFSTRGEAEKFAVKLPGARIRETVIL